MSYGRGEIIGRVERRRRFTEEQKLAVLAEVSGKDANISAVARRHGLTPSQVFKWRRLAELGVIGIAGASELPSFMAVQVAEDASVSSGTTSICEAPVGRRRNGKPIGLMEIELGNGRRIRVDRDVDADALQRVLQVLLQR
jgi:transposase